MLASVWLMSEFSDKITVLVTSQSELTDGPTPNVSFYTEIQKEIIEKCELRKHQCRDQIAHVKDHGKNVTSAAKRC